MSDPTPIIGINSDSFSDANGAITGVRVDYWHAIQALGAIPVLIPHLADPALLSALLDRIDAVILTGGDDLRPERVGGVCPPSVVPVTPERDRTDFALIEMLLARPIPTLAICLGLQELNVYRGGTLWLDLATEGPEGAVAHRGAKPYRYIEHAVRVDRESRLAQLWHDSGDLQHIDVPSAHHQAIRTLGHGLRAVAWAPDGLIEAVEIEDAPHWTAVQWHPERKLDDPRQRKLFAALLGKA